MLQLVRPLLATDLCGIEQAHDQPAEQPQQHLDADQKPDPLVQFLQEDHHLAVSLRRFLKL